MLLWSLLGLFSWVRLPPYWNENTLIGITVLNSKTRTDPMRCTKYQHWYFHIATISFFYTGLREFLGCYCEIVAEESTWTDPIYFLVFFNWDVIACSKTTWFKLLFIFADIFLKALTGGTPEQTLFSVEQTELAWRSVFGFEHHLF